MVVTLEMSFEIDWFDQRISFKNLKPESDINTINASITTKQNNYNLVFITIKYTLKHY